MGKIITITSTSNVNGEIKGIFIPNVIAKVIDTVEGNTRITYDRIKGI